MTADRKVPPMPPFTTLADLEREHNRIQRDIGKKAMTREKYAEHLSNVLPLRGIPEAWKQ